MKFRKTEETLSVDVQQQVQLLRQDLRNRLVTVFSSTNCNVVTVDRTRKAKRYKVRVVDNVFVIGSRAYAIDPDRVYYHDTGVDKTEPVFFFDADSPYPKLMHREEKKEDEVTATQMFDAIEEKVTSHIIRYAIGADQKMMRYLLFGFIGIAAVVAVGIYMNMGGFERLAELLKGTQLPNIPDFPSLPPPTPPGLGG